MEVIVYGSGAVGSTLGALLHKHTKVTLIGKERHITQINKNNLQISGQIEKTIHIPAATTIDHIPKNTVIFLTTKIYDLEPVLKVLSKKVQEDTIIIKSSILFERLV